MYYVFGTKPALLAAVLDATIAGDAEPVPVLDRPWVTALADERDAQTALDGSSAAAVAILARTAPVYEVVRRAAADPEVGALLDDNRRRRRTDQRELDRDPPGRRAPAGGARPRPRPPTCSTAS